jgi:anti-anti-sigma factor
MYHASDSAEPSETSAYGGLLRVDVLERARPRVAVFGEIDIATVDLLRDALRTAAAGSDEVTVDLSGVTFIGSTGLTLLLQMHAQAEREGRRIALTGVACCVRWILQVSGCEQRLHWDEGFGRGPGEMAGV